MFVWEVVAKVSKSMQFPPLWPNIAAWDYSKYRSSHWLKVSKSAQG